MKCNIELIKKDGKTALPVLLIIGIYIIAANIVLGRICPLRIFAGIPCPGCGITRAFLLVLQGRFYEATRIHPFWIPVTILVLAFLAVRYLVQEIRRKKRIMYIIKMFALITAILCVVYYIYRMIIWFPDREPMTYDADNIIYMFLQLLREL